LGAAIEWFNAGQEATLNFRETSLVQSVPEPDILLLTVLGLMGIRILARCRGAADAFSGLRPALATLTHRYKLLFSISMAISILLDRLGIPDFQEGLLIDISDDKTIRIACLPS
jgi:hypothetical protein